MVANRQNNVRVGYDLATEALNYLADKLSSIRDDNDQIRTELLRQELDLNVEDWRSKAERLRDIYNTPDTPAPAPGSTGRDDYILRMEMQDSFVNSIRVLICFALGVYANDLNRAKEDIPRQIITREPSPEQIQTFLEMADVQRQLGIIQEAMEKDYCGR